MSCDVMWCALKAIISPFPWRGEGNVMQCALNGFMSGTFLLKGEGNVMWCALNGIMSGTFHIRLSNRNLRARILNVERIGLFRNVRCCNIKDIMSMTFSWRRKDGGWPQLRCPLMTSASGFLSVSLFRLHLEWHSCLCLNFSHKPG